MSGRILDRTALVDFATSASVYGGAFLVAAVEMDIDLVAPAVALLDAWSAVPTPDRALLELLLETPLLRVEPLHTGGAAEAGIRVHDARTAGATYDAGSAHTVDAAMRLGYVVVTSDPGPLRVVDPAVAVEELPGF
ncbi:MAG: hypothetical protein M3Z25_13530 [Actinomycetota bacterium]|nr:hypothetical protein [Actinomycetota bacterium]